MTFRFGLMIAVVVLISASSASAATIGTAHARVWLSLEDVSTSGGRFFAFLPDPLNPPIYTSADPNSSASGFNDSNSSAAGDSLQVGDKIAADVSSQSRAVGPLGLANAFVQAGVFLVAANPTDSKLTIDFLFGVELFSGVSVDDTSREFSVAFSDVSALISGDGSFDLLFRAFTEADSDFGPYEDTLSDFVFPFSLTLTPNTFQTIALIALAETNSASLVPIPVPLTSFLLLNAIAFFSLMKLAKRVRWRA